MSQLLIVMLLFVPVVAVIAILRYNHSKKENSKASIFGSYLSDLLEKEGLLPGYRKQLLHQMVVLDSENSKLFLISRSGEGLQHRLYALSEIKSISSFAGRQSIQGERGKSETVVTRAGLSIVCDGQPDGLIVFYDHEEHSIYMLEALKTEAEELMNRIRKAGGSKEKLLPA